MERQVAATDAGEAGKGVDEGACIARVEAQIAHTILDREHAFDLVVARTDGVESKAGDPLVRRERYVARYVAECLIVLEEHSIDPDIERQGIPHSLLSGRRRRALLLLAVAEDLCRIQCLALDADRKPTH